MSKISLQIVFVVEADNKSQSDYMYIKSIMGKYYKSYLSTIKITPIYMGGIGNFDSKKLSMQSISKSTSIKAVKQK